ncbi:hypothetical protein C8J56DRAFT_902624 [Mycena floridula]|nr:hypothetical protein C8J56DRAFT_902624 [Mycena floridula]
MALLNHSTPLVFTAIPKAGVFRFDLSAENRTPATRAEGTTLTVSYMDLFKCIQLSVDVYSEGQDLTEMIPVCYPIISDLFNAQSDLPRKFALYNRTGIDVTMLRADKPSVVLTDFFPSNHPLITRPHYAMKFLAPPAPALPSMLQLGPGASASQQSLFANLMASKARQAIHAEEKSSRAYDERNAKRRRRELTEQVVDDLDGFLSDPEPVKKKKKNTNREKKKRARKQKSASSVDASGDEEMEGPSVSG